MPIGIAIALGPAHQPCPASGRLTTESGLGGYTDGSGLPYTTES